MATGMFFRDCQEWEWIPRPFDPNRALAVPRSVNALIGAKLWVIADKAWAKLPQTGLHLEPACPAARTPATDGTDPGGHADLAVLRAAGRPGPGRAYPAAGRHAAIRDPAADRGRLVQHGKTGQWIFCGRKARCHAATTIVRTL